MIQPTPGRVVWFKPEDGNTNHHVIDPDQPLSATIAFVHSDHLVNLLVVDHLGRTHPRQDVPLLQDDDKPTKDFFAAWMPYQKGQAAKAEELQAKLTGESGNQAGAGASAQAPAAAPAAPAAATEAAAPTTAAAPQPDAAAAHTAG